MNCPDCTQAATIWHWGGYHAACEGCANRALARSPKDVRSEAYRRAEAAGMGPAVRQAVSAEYQRIQKLRAGSTPS